MIPLVVLGGSGDAYLVSALYEPFRRLHQRTDVELVVHSRLAAIPEMFGIRYRTDDQLVANAQVDTEFRRNYANDLLADGLPFYCHSSFLRTRYRVDQITAKFDATQADMYRMMLGLPPETELRKPMTPNVPTRGGTVTLISDSTSWPAKQPAFWPRLHSALESAGWDVWLNDWSHTLAELLKRCAGSEWVIGPQCGVMAICCAAEFPCRKTFATPSIDNNMAPGFFARETYPYAYVTKFTGNDYDVQEVKITDRNHAEAVDAIVYGLNGVRGHLHNPTPAMTIMAPLSPGDFMDRFAILTVKRMRFSGTRKMAIEREFERNAEIFRQRSWPIEAQSLFGDLLVLHARAFDRLETVVPAAFRGDHSDDSAADAANEHLEAIDLNRQRIALKQAIDAACHAPYSEVKSYYD